MCGMTDANPKLDFSVIGGDAVSSRQWREVSALFSSAYGFYSERAPQRAGERIRLGVGYYERSYATPDYRVAFCRDGEALVAEAIYPKNSSRFFNTEAQSHRGTEVLMKMRTYRLETRVGRLHLKGESAWPQQEMGKFQFLCASVPLC